MKIFQSEFVCERIELRNVSFDSSGNVLSLIYLVHHDTGKGWAINGWKLQL